MVCFTSLKIVWFLVIANLDFNKATAIDRVANIFNQYACGSCIDELKNSDLCILSCNCTNNRPEFVDLQNDTNVPKIHCKEDNLFSVTWTAEINFVYFLEVTDEKNSTTFSDLTHCGRYVITNLQENYLYKIRLWSLNLLRNYFKKSAFLDVVTQRSNISKMTPTSIQVLNLTMTAHNYSYEAVIEWTPAEDLSCYYEVVWFGGIDMGEYKQIEIKNPMHSFQLKIAQLILETNYSVSIMATSLDPNELTESNKVWVNFTTPTCIPAHNIVNLCIPEKPKNLKITELLVADSSQNEEIDHDLYDIVLSWDSPQFDPENYVAQLKIILSGDNVTERTKNIAGNETEVTFQKVSLSSHYHVSLVARSEAGYSSSAINYRHVSTKKNKKQSWGVKSILILTIPFCVLIIIILVLIGINKYLSKKIRNKKRCQYFIELERISCGSISNLTGTSNLQETFVDEWEIKRNRIKLQTVLGEGAFGIVRRGWLNHENDTKTEVAIKMLKSKPNQDEIRQFHHEIDIMKSVPRHPHLVSLIGCVTRNRPDGPLLVVEFCALGNLQTFLRNVWEKISNQGSEVYNEVSLVPAEKSGRYFANKMYELGDILNYEDLAIQPSDLIAFARQIVLGMEHLSNLKVIHRDLAARNVLLSNDKTVKISDFGLSRDVYQDNVYCKSSNGKLPLRWMALESLTHQRYTTQSDVWSFGILLWEIVTLGATPYPGIEAKNILAYLKNGYRMEKPINCSNELYAIMSNCWKTAPKKRPNFSQLRTSIDGLLEDVSHYLNLNVLSRQTDEYIKSVVSKDNLL